MEQLIGFYAYSGFEPPTKIADSIRDFMSKLKDKETNIESNYLGNITQDVYDELEEIIMLEGEEERLINDVTTPFNIYYNPYVESFQMLNQERFDLPENENLEQWI